MSTSTSHVFEPLCFYYVYVSTRLLRRRVSERNLPKKPQLSPVCFFLVMCEVVVRGLWNLFHKAPLMGSSLWNTNGSFSCATVSGTNLV